MSRDNNQNTRVARQVARKIKLENTFKPEIRKFFRQVSKDVAAVYQSTQSVPSLRVYSLELIALLRNHYRRVSRAFSTDSRDEIEKSRLFLETKQEQDIDKEIVDYINQHSIEQSLFILQTTEKDLNTAITTVVAAAILGDENLTNQQIAKRIERDFIVRTNGRVDTIAMTETQTPSEEIKLIEVAAIAETLRVTTGQTMIKTWHTILDEKTRASHVRADLQKKNIDQPFIVQGQFLKAPGDTSLGATLDNIINCRCTSISSVIGTPNSIVGGDNNLLQ